MSTSTITEAECTKIHMIKISQQYCLVTAKDRKHIKNACFKHLLKKKNKIKNKSTLIFTSFLSVICRVDAWVWYFQAHSRDKITISFNTTISISVRLFKLCF